MTAETASDATTTNRRPRPLANTPLPTGAAYVWAELGAAIWDLRVRAVINGIGGSRRTTQSDRRTYRHAEGMALPTSVPDAGAVAENTKPDRDRAVDVARLAALVVVMFGHCALLLATIDSGG